jgi:hypothetical protein
VLHAVLADRAEQRFREAAVPAAAYHKQIGAVAGIEQYLGGGPSVTWVRTETPLAGSRVLLIASVRVLAATSWKS